MNLLLNIFNVIKYINLGFNPHMILGGGRECIIIPILLLTRQNNKNAQTKA